MPQRRAPFDYGSGMSDGDTTGAAPPMALPLTGTGTQGQTQALSQGMDPNGESPATLRRRIMPIAGPMQQEPDVLTAVQQMLAQRKAGQ